MAICVGSRLVPGIAALCASFIAQSTSQAHFVLESPSAMNEQNALGDPQKAPPCGDNGNAVPTGLVTTVQAGSTITVTIDETIFHPGHYRIALAVDDIGELPDPAPVTPGMTEDCGSAPIQDPPVFPVLADGVFQHTEEFTEPQSIDITLPDDVTCTNCTLQVIQFMSDHGLNDPGGCYYHHCANLAVEPGPAEATSTSSDDSGATSDGDPSDTTVTTAPTADGTAGMGDTSEDPDDEDTNGASPGSGTAGVDTDPGQAPTNTDSGCGCSRSRGRGSHPLATLVGLFALVGLRARRRADRRTR